MGSRWAAASALLLVTVGLSGCTAGLGALGAGVPVEAPVWEAGYSWTYDVRTESVFGFSSDGEVGFEPRQDDFQVSYRVTNTTEPLAGIGVYYLEASQSVDAPLRDHPVQALSKEDLQLVGQASRHPLVPEAPPRPVSVDSASLSYLGPPPVEIPDPCEGRTPIEPVDEEERIDVPRFPLEPGRTWSGTWMMEDDFGFFFTAEIHEPRRVTVPAGTFEAVPIVVDLRPIGSPFGPQGPSFDMEFQLQNWYSPEARWDVKTIFAMHASGSFAGESLDARQKVTMELAEYSLDATQAEPAPYVRNDTAYRSRPTFNVVTDTEFPVNLADGPVTASFALDAGAPDNGHVARDGALDRGGPEVRSDLSAAHGPDPTTYDVMWRLLRDGAVAGSGNGSAFSVNVTDGGSYHIQPYVIPKECGSPSASATSAAFDTFWERTFTFDVGLGFNERAAEEAFPVDRSRAFGILEWAVVNDHPASQDRGHPVLVDPSGRELQPPEDFVQYGPESAVFFADDAGGWGVAWEAEGVSTGHSVTMTLRIDYGGPFVY